MFKAASCGVEKMTNGWFRHLPVIRHEKLIGPVSIGELVKYRLAEYEYVRAQCVPAFRQPSRGQLEHRIATQRLAMNEWQYIKLMSVVSRYARHSATGHRMVNSF